MIRAVGVPHNFGGPGCGLLTALIAAMTSTETESLPLELRDVHEQIEEVRGQLQQLLFGVSEEAFLWRPEPRRWSISECLVHLDTTAALYTSAIDRAIAADQPAAAEESLPRRGFLGRWMLNTLEPPVTRRFTAPGAFAPGGPKPLDEVVPEFLRWQDEVQQRLVAAKDLDLWRTKVKSPAVPLLKFSLGETFAIIAAHERRHLAQAEEVKGSPDFPCS